MAKLIGVRVVNANPDTGEDRATEEKCTSMFCDERIPAWKCMVVGLCDKCNDRLNLVATTLHKMGEATFGRDIVKITRSGDRTKPLHVSVEARWGENKGVFIDGYVFDDMVRHMMNFMVQAQEQEGLATMDARLDAIGEAAVAMGFDVYNEGTTK